MSALRERVILHCDLNAFYCSVELLSHPELQEVPTAVCGDPLSRHGIILAKNEAAKKYGVQTAETVWQARRKCPGLQLLPPHHDLYAEYSVKVNEIYQRYTDQVEPFSIDESWLDVTGSQQLFGDGKTIADDIRATVKRELGLSVSVGVSFCKVFAKMGRDMKKPDATTVLDRQNWRQILYPMPVGSLLFVGQATEEKLERYGIKTIGDLAKLEEDDLRGLLGKQGGTLYRYVNGLENEPVRHIDDPDEIKSIGNSTTFRRNLVGLEDIRTGVISLSSLVGYRLRKHALKCYGVQVTIKDPQFNVRDRQTQLQHPTNITREIYSTAMELIQKSWKLRDPIRLLAVTAISLVPEDTGEQLNMFEQSDGRLRLEALDRSLDKVQNKYGKGVVKPASVLKNDIGVD